MSNELPDIPLEDLFKEVKVAYTWNEIPLRWLSFNSTKDILGISKRSIRRYAKRGLLDRKYKTVNGNVRVYYTNRSVYRLKDRRKERKIKNHPKDKDMGIKELLQMGDVIMQLGL